MPHMYVEYTNNLQGLNEAALMEALNATVCGHPTVSDEADVKTRIAQVSHYRIGLNSAGRAFAHVELRLMAGRTAEVKKELSDRIAAVLERMIPVFRSDRFAGGVPDAFQSTATPARFVAGEFTAAQVVDGWRSQFEARGVAQGAIVDWLPWWDNAWVSVLRSELPNARLLLAVRDPRDMLIDWLAFGTMLTLRIDSADRAAAWLARHLGQLADIVEQDLVPHTLVRTDAPAADPAALAASLGEALGITDFPTPPLDALGQDRFPVGHWRNYIQHLPKAISALTPVAVRLGYPRD